MTTVQLTLPDGVAWRPDPPADEAERRVLRALSCGHRIPRAVLARTTDLPDRTVRRAVERLRLAGWPITSSTSAAGYQLSDAPLDLDATERNLRSRALTALRTYTRFRRARERRAVA